MQFNFTEEQKTEIKAFLVKPTKATLHHHSSIDITEQTRYRFSLMLCDLHYLVGLRNSQLPIKVGNHTIESIREELRHLSTPGTHSIKNLNKVLDVDIIDINGWDIIVDFPGFFIAKNLLGEMIKIEFTLQYLETFKLG